jgi:hypothetical protein
MPLLGWVIGNVVDLRKRELVFEYRILNKECRIMKFNMIFPYFDISYPDKSEFSIYSKFYGSKKMLTSTTLGIRGGSHALFKFSSISLRDCHLNFSVLDFSKSGKYFISEILPMRLCSVWRKKQANCRRDKSLNFTILWLVRFLATLRNDR